MDNSDSEYFESADEDIQSDDEKCVENVQGEDDSQKDDQSQQSCGEKEKVKNQNSSDQKQKSKCIENRITDEADTSNEPPLNLKFKSMDLKSEESTSHKEKSLGIENSNNDSENLTVVEYTVKDYTPNESSKKNKSRIKSKLGSKTKNESIQFEASPKKQTTGIIDNTKPDTEKVKDLGSAKKDAQIVEDENLWDDDELDWGAEAHEDSKTVLQPSSSIIQTSRRLNEDKQNTVPDSWSSWSNWGVSVFSTATQGVSTITSQITNVIESGLGAVDPEELARIEKEETRKTIKESVESNIEKRQNFDQSETYSSFGLGNLVKLVENTGTKVISGGLDTLESIGKKTMEVLQEGDPGLKKKRAFLKIDQDKPVLSQILREAKERAENDLRTTEEPSKKKWKNYETLFDDHHGLVHLEALELLSKQCEIKLKTIQSTMGGDEFTDFSETMDQIKELCELPDEDDEEQMTLDEIKKKLEKAVGEMNVQITYEKLVANWEEMDIWLSTLDLNICDEKEVHQQAIETLAEMTSRAMEQFHKTGELLLVKDRRSTADEADSLVQITATLIALIGIVAAKFCEKLNGKVASNKEVSGLITNVFFEAANSSSYIQDALQLLIPVLQVGAT